ncbi:MAG TPA: Rho termination factor N-terminal domain-containing protein [Solirubrobacteraceae bacterium]|jgi:transcription termination factor Rho
MSVFERSELEASPLADLHAIADQLGLDGFRRLRKGDLIDAILGEPGASADENGSARSADGAAGGGEDGPDAEDERDRSEIGQRPPRRRRARRSAAKDSSGESDSTEAGGEDKGDEPSSGARAARPRRARSSRSDREQEAGGRGQGAGGRAPRQRGERADSAPGVAADDDADTRVAEGVVELLGNGSAFLRVSPPEPSDEDVYISAAQVRRCELVSGDRVSGPVRTPRRSERYSSLVRIDTINGASADTVSEGARYDDLPVAYPSERLALDSKDPTLEAIEWLTPLGRGSRAVIVGAPRSGKTETLRRLLDAVSGREGLDLTVVLAGARPEEITAWQDSPVAPAAALSLAASADSQGQAVERAIDAAKRVAARGGDALVLIDSLDGLHPHAARKALVAARNLREDGSLTVIATASRPFGGETTVISLDVALTSTGRQPILNLIDSGTLKPELLVGEDGAEAITKARAAAVEAN